MFKPLKRKLRHFLNTRKAAKLQKTFDQGKIIPAPPTTGDTLRFLAVGRQGYGTPTTARVAAAMETAAAEKPTHGVFYLGDNFYPRGPRDTADVQWRLNFEYLYDGPHLRGMPFFAIMGNHDHLGDPQAQIDYAKQKKGTGRWHMDGLIWRRDFGRASGRVLVRCVFLDTMTLVTNPQPQIDYARESFATDGNPIWRLVIAHGNGRSLTKQHTAERVLTPWLDQFTAMHVDAFLSADDWFQQMLDYPGEPLHVSTNGGSDKNETGLVANEPSREFIASQPGFGLIEVAPGTLTVQLRNARGEAVHTGTRTR